MRFVLDLYGLISYVISHWSLSSMCREEAAFNQVLPTTYVAFVTFGTYIAGTQELPDGQLHQVCILMEY